MKTNEGPWSVKKTSKRIYCQLHIGDFLVSAEKVSSLYWHVIVLGPGIQRYRQWKANLRPRTVQIRAFDLAKKLIKERAAVMHDAELVVDDIEEKHYNYFVGAE